jgi:hypothetical protein
MKKICFFLMVVAVLACSCFAADGKPVSYKSGDETVQAVL